MLCKGGGTAGGPASQPIPRRMLLRERCRLSPASSPRLPHPAPAGRDGSDQCLPVPRAPSPSDRPPGAAAGSRRRRDLSEGRYERWGRRGSAPPPPAPDRPRPDPQTFLTTYPLSQRQARSGRGSEGTVAFPNPGISAVHSLAGQV